MEIYFKEEAKDKLINGVNKLVQAVGSTLGPKGKTVIIPSKEEYGKYDVTKDGVSVAESIKFKDPVENIGAQLVKQAARETLKKAGDGTTTATVLAGAFINNLKDFEYTEVNKAFDEIIPKVIEQLKANSRQLNRENIRYVASISANNDLQVGDIIQQAYNHSDVIKVEQTTNLEDKLTKVDGMKLEVSYFSKHFITNPSKGICELENPAVLLLDGKLEKLENFREPLETVLKQGRPLLIITEHIHDQALRILETSVINQETKVCVIKAPGFGPHRKDLLSDLAEFTGAKLIDDMSKNYNYSILGGLESCSISITNSILVKHKSIDCNTRLDNLEKLYNHESISDYEKDLLKRRINNLKGTVSLIQVGGKTEQEVKEKYDRYDDAVKAVRCALEEGIVEGGGHALVKSVATDKTDYAEIETAIYVSLNEPFLTIWRNGGIKDFSRNMFDENIIDPLKVTRTALENAVSVAKTILSTETVVIQEQQWMN